MKKKLLLALPILFLFVGLSIYNRIPEERLPANTRIDKLIVHKAQRKLLAYSNGLLVKTYDISLGGQPIGDKECEGDNKTPEGIYTINDKNPNSGYHKNLGISYPNESDIEHAKQIGKPVGGDIKIHGIRNIMWFIGKCSMTGP
jgi:murein L,D-transpeptidase YafK